MPATLTVTKSPLELSGSREASRTNRVSVVSLLKGTRGGALLQ